VIEPHHLRTVSSECLCNRRAQGAERAGDGYHLPGKIDVDAAHFIVLVGNPKL
jgi:hypothetical protein